MPQVSEGISIQNGKDQGLKLTVNLPLCVGSLFWLHLAKNSFTELLLISETSETNTLILPSPQPPHPIFSIQGQIIWITQQLKTKTFSSSSLQLPITPSLRCPTARKRSPLLIQPHHQQCSQCDESGVSHTAFSNYCALKSLRESV